MSDNAELGMKAMIDRAAKALWPDAFEGDGAGWDQRRSVARDQALAVLKALRNPPHSLVRGIMQASLDCTPIDRCEQQALKVWNNTLNAIIFEAERE